LVKIKAFFLFVKINNAEKMITASIDGKCKEDTWQSHYGPASDSVELHTNTLRAFEESLNSLEEYFGPIISVVKTDKIITGEMLEEVITYTFLIFCSIKK